MKSYSLSYLEPRKAQGVSSAHYEILNVSGVSVAEEPATIKSFLDVFQSCYWAWKTSHSQMWRAKELEEHIYSELLKGHSVQATVHIFRATKMWMTGQTPAEAGMRCFFVLVI